MQVSREDVLHCAKLAHLNLQEAEIEPLREAMTRILSHAASLDELDLADVPPYALATPLPRREDVVLEGFTQAQALAQAPEADRGHFVVPPVQPA